MTLMQEKTHLIDFAGKRLKINSFCDLGGVWGVAGGYTFYTLEKYGNMRSFLIDTDISADVEAKKEEFSGLCLIKSNFGNVDLLSMIGNIDAVFLFDVLLHQVSPDWDEIISMYANNTRIFLVYNQQYIGHKTVRLLDLGKKDYFENVPHDVEHPAYKALWERMYEIHPQHNRIYRDIHNVWQWGITHADLISTMNRNDFEEIYHINYGQWGPLKKFEGHAYIFKKKWSS